MYTATDVDRCVAIGHDAMKSANEDDADGSIAIGYAAAYRSAPTGSGSATGGNILIGYSAGYDATNTQGLTTGIKNTVVGFEAFGANCGASGDIAAASAGQGSGNTVMGYRAGYDMKTTVRDCTLVGVTAGTNITTGSWNTCIGRESGGAITSGWGNITVGSSANGVATGEGQVSMGYAAVTKNNYEVRLGYYGGFQFYSKLVSCVWGGVAENDPAHGGAICKIPRYSVITRATVVVTTLSSDANHTLKLVLSTDSSGSDNTALNGVQEVIGAGVTESWGGTGDDGTAIDINVASGATIKAAYGTVSLGGDNSLSTIDTSAADLYAYMAFADTNHTGGDANPSTAPVVRVMIEFAGED